MCNYHRPYSAYQFSTYILTCDSYYGRYPLFTGTELCSRMNDVFGYTVSDYELIKSRCSSFQLNSALCTWHRYVLCEGYVPELRCACYPCLNITGLMQMGVRTALFIGSVPILGYICSRHRDHFGEQMLRQNLEPIVTTPDRQLYIWDYVLKAPLINNDTSFSENSLAITTNQNECEDRYSCHRSENKRGSSIVMDIDPSNPSSIENDSKTSETHRVPHAGQDDHAMERGNHANEERQLNVSILADNSRVIQVTETNQDHRTKTFRKQSSPSKSSHVESIEMQQFIRIKICASHSTSHQWQSIDVLETDTFATIKTMIIKIFGLNHCLEDLSLRYASPNSDGIYWKTLKTEEEDRTLTEYSFGDDYIVTCVPSNDLENEYTRALHHTQESDCTRDSQNNVYPLPGLQNLDNTCFMNSALQCLNHVQSFFNYFRDTKNKSLFDNESLVKGKRLLFIQLYSRLIESLCSSDDGPVIPVEFHQKFQTLAPRFPNYHQHDSMEFLNTLLDTLHESFMHILQQNYTIISKTFHGQIRTVVTCKICQEDLSTDDVFTFLPLSIPEEGNSEQSSRRRSYKLDQCFKTLLREEYIGSHGKWYCEHCKQLTDAYKKVFLHKLPPVLILQIKRFNYDLQSHTKINTLIEYDLDNLDVEEYVSSSRRNTCIRYNLIAVVNHFGSLINGHFFTYAKLPGTEDWYEYNDDRVNKVGKNVHMNNYSAYILVYQQDKNESIISTTL